MKRISVMKRMRGFTVIEVVLVVVIVAIVIGFSGLGIYKQYYEIHRTGAFQKSPYQIKAGEAAYFVWKSEFREGAGGTLQPDSGRTITFAVSPATAGGATFVYDANGNKYYTTPLPSFTATTDKNGRVSFIVMLDHIGQAQVTANDTALKAIEIKSFNIIP